MTLGFLCSMLNEDLEIVVEEKSNQTAHITNVKAVLNNENLTNKKVIDFDLSQQIIFVK